MRFSFCKTDEDMAAGAERLARLVHVLLWVAILVVVAWLARDAVLGALGGELLDEVLGPDDDITFFDYIKRNNRDTGTAVVGLELGDPDDLLPLLARMDTSPLEIETIPPDSPLFRVIG